MPHPDSLRICLAASTGMALLLLALSGPADAVPEVALHADFDADALDSPPSLAPPGDPPSDELRLYGSAGDWTVRDAVGGMTDQPLEMERGSGTGAFSLIAYLDPTYANCSSYTASWRSMVLSDVFYVYISLKTSGGWIIGSLEYRSGGLLTYGMVGNELSVGYVPGVEQLFEITVDRVAHTTNLSIDGVAVPEAQGWPASASPEFVSVTATFGGIYASTLVIDDIHVMAECSPSAVESEGWGRIKALYR